LPPQPAAPPPLQWSNNQFLNPNAKMAASDLAFVTAFLDSCRERGLDKSAVDQAVAVASRLHPSVKEAFEKAAGWADLLKAGPAIGSAVGSGLGKLKSFAMPAVRVGGGAALGQQAGGEMGLTGNETVDRLSGGLIGGVTGGYAPKLPSFVPRAATGAAGLASASAPIGRMASQIRGGTPAEQQTAGQQSARSGFLSGGALGGTVPGAATALGGQAVAVPLLANQAQASGLPAAARQGYAAIQAAQQGGVSPEEFARDPAMAMVRSSPELNNLFNQAQSASQAWQSFNADPMGSMIQRVFPGANANAQGQGMQRYWNMIPQEFHAPIAIALGTGALTGAGNAFGVGNMGTTLGLTTMLPVLAYYWPRIMQYMQAGRAA
jgi:hypothetical protein